MNISFYISETEYMSDIAQGWKDLFLLMIQRNNFC